MTIALADSHERASAGARESPEKEVEVSQDRISRGQFIGATGAALGVAAGLTGTGLAGTVRRSERNAVAAAKAKPFLIGSPFPLHSFYAADGEQMQNGSGLAIEEINSAGGIAGRKIDRIVIDADVASPEGVTTAFRKLVSSNVDAFVVGYLQVDAPSYDIAAAYGAPYLHGNTIEAGVARVRANPQKYYNIFNVDSTEVHYGKNMPLFLDRLAKTGQWAPKTKTVHFIQGDLAYSQTISQAAQAAFKAAGWKSMGVEKVVTPINDWGPVISKLHSGPAAVIMNCHPAPADLAAFIKQFNANPTDSLVYMQYGPSIPQFLQLAGAAANGSIWSTVVGTPNDVIGLDFQKKYQARFKKPAGFANAGQCYDEVNMLARAWAMVGDPRNFKAVCNVLRTQIHRGVSGSFWLNHPGQSNWLYPFETEDSSLGEPHLFFQIQNQKQKIIFPPLYADTTFKKAPYQK